MPDSHFKETFWKKFKSKYRLTILNDTTFEEVFWLRLSRLNLVGVLGIASILFALTIFALVAYTPIRVFIPGYPDGSTHANIIRNAYRLDSMEQKLIIYDQYLNNIRTIFQGETPINHNDSSAIFTKPLSIDTMALSVSQKDSMFRARMEQENEFDYLSANVKIEEDLTLFPPVHGILTKHYEPKANHFGVDVATKEGEEIKACFKGTVIFAEWSMETGYVVQIQHPKSLISVYKHLKELNVQQGDRVETGRKIGNSGDVGTLSTGPHLHFELWRDGISIPPTESIVF